MVDGLDYPRAFIRYGNLKIVFTESRWEGTRLIAKAEFDFEGDQ